MRLQIMRGVSSALLAAGFCLPATAATFTWDGAPDAGGASANNNTLTGTNWVGDASPGDSNANDHLYTGSPALTTINYGPGNSFVNDLSHMTFAAGLNSNLVITGNFRVANQPYFRQDSGRQIDIQASFNNFASIGGAGTGLFTISGALARPNGDNSASFTIDNGGFNVVYSGTIAAGNDWWNITKTGNGTLTVSGDWDMVDTTDYAAATFGLKLSAGSTLVNGTVDGGNVAVQGGSFGGSGTLGYYISGTKSDLINFDSGSLDLSNLTIDFQALTGGVTETEYVLVDYTGANLGGSDTLTLDTGNLLTDGTFGGATNIPAGYSIVHDENASQILLVVPEPTSLALLTTGILALLRRRRR